MATSKTPSAADKAKADALIKQQLEQGQKVLDAPAKGAKIRLSPAAHQASVKIFEVNQLGIGTKPESVGPDEIKELMAANALERSGHAKGTRYTLLVRPLDMIRDDLLVKRKSKAGRKPGARAASEPREPRSSVLTIGASEKAYLKENIRAYLALATGAEARKHEEKRQSENILDVIHARAKEILKASKVGDGPRVTPQQALAIAQEELAQDFETRLKRDFKPILFDIFGLEETPDTDMRTMRG